MLGALILTGGASSRMGEDKATLAWGGLRAVDLVGLRAEAVGASPVLTVGGRDLGRPNVEEPQPGSGPVAGIVAGLHALSGAGCRRALVLAVDAPTLLDGDLAPLLAAPSPGAAYAHLHLPLIMEVSALPSAAGAGWSMARLIREAGLRLLEPDPDAARRLRGANTPAERKPLLEAFLKLSGARK